MDSPTKHVSGTGLVGTDSPFAAESPRETRHLLTPIERNQVETEEKEQGGGAADFARMQGMIGANNAGEVGGGYDVRYKPRTSSGGVVEEKSEYDNRFGPDPVAAGERRSFARTADKMRPLTQARVDAVNKSVDVLSRSAEGRKLASLLVKPATINVVNFGCGSGRDLGLLEDLAKKSRSFGPTSRSVGAVMHGASGATVHTKAYDISSSGILSYRKKLEDAGYKRIEPEGSSTKPLATVEFYGEAVDGMSAEFERKHHHDAGEVSQDLSADLSTSPSLVEFGDMGGPFVNCGTYRKDNLEIELLYPRNPNITTRELREGFGGNDMAIILFGVTSHIFPKAKRDEVMKSFVDDSAGHVFMTVPGTRMFVDRQKIYNDAGLKNLIGIQEDGTLFYSPDPQNPDLTLPYKVYDDSGVESLREAVGVGEGDFHHGVSSFLTHVALATKKPTLGKFDSALASGLTWLGDRFPRVARAVTRRTGVKYYDVEIRGGRKEAIGEGVWHGVATNGSHGDSPTDLGCTSIAVPSDDAKIDIPPSSVASIDASGRSVTKLAGPSAFQQNFKN